MANPSPEDIIIIEEKDWYQRGSTLRATFEVDTVSLVTRTSRKFTISGLTVLQLKITPSQVNVDNKRELTKSFVHNSDMILVKFTKYRDDDMSTYVIKIASSALGIINEEFASYDGSWKLLHLLQIHPRTTQYKFDIHAKVDVVPKTNSFAPLYDDVDITDFQLTAEDGTVHFHRAILAISSVVFKDKLGSVWKNGNEGSLDLQGVQKKTLTDLKFYLYKHKLPDTDLEKLLLVAARYKIPDLEQKCVDKLMDGLTEKSAVSLLEFGTINRLSSLLMGILECVRNGAMDLNEMREHFSTWALVGP